MKLSIIVPAYNEEKAIAATLANCLTAADALCAENVFDVVEVIVVDDGSRDGTASIVHSLLRVVLIQHEKNRGYGAALLSGFAAAHGDILSFLDGDNTCDAMDFIIMARTLREQKADMVIGARLHGESQMPLVRRIGNYFFAQLINFLGDAGITDSASGMRMFTRDALAHLLPLPTGLHFTPAMSAKAMLDATLTIREVPIHYHERMGRSKLSVWKDGVRFLNVIMKTAFLYRPFKLLGTIGIAGLVVALFSYFYTSVVVTWAVVCLSMLVILLGLFMNEMVIVLTNVRRLRHSFAYRLFTPLRHTGILFALGVLVFVLAAVFHQIAQTLLLWPVLFGCELIVFGVLFLSIGQIEQVITFRAQKK